MWIKFDWIHILSSKIKRKFDELDLEQDEFYLIQANAINDSLLLLFKETIPALDLFAGPASYHRIVTPNQYQELLNVITEDYLNRPN